MVNSRCCKAALRSYQVACSEGASASGGCNENAGQAQGKDDGLATIQTSINLLILHGRFLQEQ